MHTISESFPEESPTRPTSPAQTLVTLTKIDRLAEVALERLTVVPDPEAVQKACEDLASIRALAAEVLR